MVIDLDNKKFLRCNIYALYLQLQVIDILHCVMTFKKVPMGELSNKAKVDIKKLKAFMSLEKDTLEIREISALFTALDISPRISCTRMPDHVDDFICKQKTK